MEILRKLLENVNDFHRVLPNEMLREILLFLRLYSENRELAISSLRILLICCDDEQKLEFLSQN